MTTRQTRPIGPGWFGYLTLENLEELATAVRTFLSDNQYTFVSVNEARGPVPRPEVRTSQRLEAVHTWYGDDERFGGFHVNDSYGVWGCMTEERDEKRPYLAFAWGTLTIEHFAAAGNKIIWVIALERT